MGPERRFLGGQTDGIMDFESDSAEKDVADVERLLASL